MTRQLEDTEYAHQPNDTQDGQAHGLVGRFVLRRDRRAWQVQFILFFSHNGRERDEVRNNSDNIYYVHDVSKEIELVRTSKKPHYQLKREPDNTQRLSKEEWVSDVGNLVLFDLGGVGSSVEDLVVFELGKGLEAEDDDGEQDHDHGDDGNDAGGLRALGVFEKKPDFALTLVGGQRLLLLLDEAFVLPKTIRTLTSLAYFSY